MHNLKVILEAAACRSPCGKNHHFSYRHAPLRRGERGVRLFFESDFPARETVQVSALPKFVNVEISMIAVSNMRKLLRHIFLKPVLRISNRYASKPDRQRIFAALSDLLSCILDGEKGKA
jgi:hypothetical protein